MSKWWSLNEDETVLRLRDTACLDWTAIANALPGRSPQACRQRYYSKLKGARNRAARPRGPAPTKPRKRLRKPRPVLGLPPEAPARAEGVAPLRVDIGHARRGPDLTTLREMAELRLRIAEHGLTRALFGDPPPGRSALDQRRSRDG